MIFGKISCSGRLQESTLGSTKQELPLFNLFSLGVKTLCESTTGLQLQTAQLVLGDKRRGLSIRPRSRKNRKRKKNTSQKTNRINRHALFQQRKYHLHQRAEREGRTAQMKM